jgi:DNA-binding response OmpR family regulator
MLQPDRTLSIGIIDPDPSSRTAMARLLLAHGHPAQSYFSLADYGAQVADDAPFDLLFIDVLDFLAADPGTRKRLCRRSAVIALGDEVRVEDIGRSLEAGCADFLVRPVPSALLLHVMARATGLARVG